MREQAAAESDQGDAKAEQRPRLKRRGQDHAGERDDADERAEARDAMGIGAVRQPPRSEHEARAAAERQHRGERRRHADRQMKDLSAIGLEQDVLHAEAGGAERGRDEAPARPARRRRNRVQASRKRIGRAVDAASFKLRGSCFQSAAQFSTIVVSAAPCTTWISRTSVKWRRSKAEHDAR